MCCETCDVHVEEKDADLNKLVDLANVLDEKGLTAEANLVDSLIVEAKKNKDEKKKKKEDKKEDKKEKKDDKKKGKKPFWLQKKKAELIQLADTLDKKGLTAEANEIDKIVKSLVVRRTRFATMSVPIPGFEGFTLQYMGNPSIIGQIMRAADFQHDNEANGWYAGLVNNPPIELMYKGVSVSGEALIIGMFPEDVDIENLVKEGKDDEAARLLLERLAEYVRGCMPGNISALIEYGTCRSGEAAALIPAMQNELKETYQIG